VNSLFKFRFFIASLLLFGLNLSCAQPGNSPLPQGVPPADTPANGVYFIENDPVQLENGLAEMEAAPGSASIIRIVLLGEALYSYLNDDTEKDAVIFLTYQGGGSGTFFYLAVALHENGGFKGKNSIWLGDRIGLPIARVQNGLITVKYLDRSYDEPMATAPSLEQTRYFIVDDSGLQEIITAADEAVIQGWLTIGHEVRSFLPCNKTDELWLTGNSPALDTIISAHGKSIAGLPPYTPVFAILSGSRIASPEAGFGADYKESFSPSRLIRIWPQGNCRGDFILLDSPLPGAAISSPLKIQGQARGTWFFEGDFPVILFNSQAEKIAESYATAKGEWMTENFVEFEGIISFESSLSGQQGTLILKKDNPTGLAQFDDELKIPVHFK
jgi:hypothetical protein